MVKIKHAVSTRRRKKRLIKQAKGQFGQKSKRYQQALLSLQKGKVYAYRDRKVKKREIRNLWIIRINAICQENGITYSRFINGLREAKVNIDRKILADLAVNSPEAFKKLVEAAQAGNGEVK